MLSNVINKYKSEYIKETTNFKDKLVNKVNKFLDIVVEESIPEKELKEAVENTRSKVLVEQIANLIGVDKLQQNKLKIKIVFKLIT